MGSEMSARSHDVGDGALESLRTQIALLAARVEAQAAEIEVLRRAHQEAGLADSAIAAPTGAAPVAPGKASLRAPDDARGSASMGESVATPIDARVGRRGMLTKVLGATAAAAVLTLAKEAAPASATTRTTIINDASTTYGLLASDGGDPLPQLPNLNGFNFGAIGSRAPSGFAAPASAGVFGSGGASYGVLGLSGSGIGVFGRSSGNVGTTGFSTSSIGVYADSASDTAVFATSPARGVWGRTTGGIGVFGQATVASATTYGVYGAAPPPGWAGFFEGNVYVTGQLVVAGRVLDEAQGGDGAARATYSVAAAEPLVEDVGEAKLVNGRATVTLDPAFESIVKGERYLVFLTEIGDSGGLYVAEQRAQSFEVRSRTVSKTPTTFQYRIVVRKVGDAAGKRLEALPRPRAFDAKELPVPTMPKEGERGGAR